MTRMTRGVLIAGGLLFIGAAIYLGLVEKPTPGYSGPALLCCLAAAILFAGSFPSDGGSAA
jgi:hypothetical protein